jgi:hypothetical protein
VYAGGRPLWQLSIAVHDARGPAPVLRWSLTTHRHVDAARDRILAGAGTDEPLIETNELDEIEAMMPGYRRVTKQWRKPLRIDEINLLAPTPEVLARPGRP